MTLRLFFPRPVTSGFKWQWYNSCLILAQGDAVKVIDPVCKMEIDSEEAAATSQYKDKTIYFCAKGCKIAFDKDPEKYLGK